MLKKLQSRFDKGDEIVIDLVKGMLCEICPVHEVSIVNNYGTIQTQDQIRFTPSEYIMFPPMEAFQLKYINRLRGCKVAGFEGVKLLNLKINKKRPADKLIDL